MTSSSTTQDESFAPDESERTDSILAPIVQSCWLFSSSGVPIAIGASRQEDARRVLCELTDCTSRKVMSDQMPGHASVPIMRHGTFFDVTDLTVIPIALKSIEF